MADLDLSVDAGARFSISPSMLDAQGLREIQAILWEIIFTWREIMQGSWPRDSGASFQAWRSLVVGLVLEVSNPIEYASFVHPAGEDEGASGEFLEEALDRLLSESTSAILQATVDSEERRGSGFAQAAEMVGAPGPQLGGGLQAATVRAFAARGARARQRAIFPGVPLSQRESRTVITNIGGALVRFRQRVRTRVRQEQ